MRLGLLLGPAWLAGTAACAAVAWYGLRLEPAATALRATSPSATAVERAAPTPGVTPVSSFTATAAPTTTVAGTMTGAPTSGGAAAAPATAAAAAAASGPGPSAPPPVPDPAVVSAGTGAVYEESFGLVGGVVAARFSSGGAEVLWATPNAGFSVEIEQEVAGPKVEFRSDRHRSRIDLWWQEGPRHAIEERAD